MAASEEMKTLLKKRDDIENQIKELTEVLESQKGVGMDGPLIDPEGYPRADIDVYSVRHARHQIACLQTDYKLVMKDIEAELYRIHDNLRQGREAGQEPMEVAQAHTTSGAEVTTFLKVNRVDAGSPAAAAGVEVGDEVAAFGSVTAANFTGIQQIGELVQHSVGRSLKVRVVRNGKLLNIALTPGAWSGPGNLGCNIVPIKR